MLRWIALSVTVIALAGCGGDSKSSSSGLPQGTKPSKLDDWPLKPVYHWFYLEV